MGFRQVALVCLFLAAGFGLATSSASQSAPRPNVIFIMLDDLDYEDVGAYGSRDVFTPSIDALATEGMRFEQYYANAPVCSPSRIAILTGQYPERYGVHRSILSTSTQGIPRTVATLPKVLRTAGYRTGHIGKWHVGERRPEFLPTGVGFDISVRLVVEEGYYGYRRFKLSFDDGDSMTSKEGQHLTEVLTDHAIAFLESSLKEHAEQPFFLNLWYFAPHVPLEPPSGFDNAETDYCLDADACDVLQYRRGKFGALVTNADRQIQRIIDFLDSRPGLRENTLVIITSDNGGEFGTHNSRILPHRKLRGVKADLFEGGIRVPLIVRWPGIVPAGTVNYSVVASFDLLPTLADAAGVDLRVIDTDGTSVWSIVRQGEGRPRDDLLFWENKASNTAFENASGIYNTYAVRRGDWKMVYDPSRTPKGSDTVMLFNLAADPSEQQNLVREPYSKGRSLSVLGLRFGVSKVRSDLEVGAPEKYRVFLNELQQKYYEWRRDAGTVSYEYTPSPSGVVVEKEAFKFNGGVVTVMDDPRLDVTDYDFSFSAQIRSSERQRTAVLAEKPTSWQLVLDQDTLGLRIWGEDSTDRPTEVLLKGLVNPERGHHVAFTVYGWRDSESTLRLYIDGQLVDEAKGEGSIARIRSRENRDGDPIMYLGNSKDGKAPFHGIMSAPRMSVLALYPGEVFSEYSESPFGIPADPDGRAISASNDVARYTSWISAAVAVIGIFLLICMMIWYRTRLRNRRDQNLTAA